MSTFEEKLKEYYERLANNPQIVQGFNNRGDNSKRAREVFLSPKDYAELIFADSVLTFFIDSTDMFYRSLELKKPDYENMKIVNYYASLINAFRSGNPDEIDRVRQEVESLSPEECGEVAFDAIYTIVYGPYEFMEQIQARTDITDSQTFMSYYGIANSIMSGVTGIGLNDIDAILDDPNKFDYVHRMVGSFDKQYQKTMNKEKDSQKEKIDDK